MTAQPADEIGPLLPNEFSHALLILVGVPQVVVRRIGARVKAAETRIQATCKHEDCWTNVGNTIRELAVLHRRQKILEPSELRVGQGTIKLIEEDQRSAMRRTGLFCDLI